MKNNKQIPKTIYISALLLMWGLQIGLNLLGAGVETSTPSPLQQVQLSANHRAREALRHLPPSRPLRLLFIGDSCGAGNRVFKRIVEVINRLSPQPDLIVHLGDFAHGGLKRQYIDYIRILETVQAPVLQVAGNHDLKNRGKQWFELYFGPLDFFADAGNHRIIILGNAHGGNKAGFLESQLHWLESTINDADDKQTIVCAHIPPTDPFRGHSRNVLLHLRKKPKNQDQFLSLLQNHRVALACFGHHHVFSALQHSETWFMISGGGGQPRESILFRGGWDTPHYSSQHHFIMVDFQPGESWNGTLFIIPEKTIRLPEAVLSSLELFRTPPPARLSQPFPIRENQD